MYRNIEIAANYQDMATELAEKSPRYMITDAAVNWLMGITLQLLTAETEQREDVWFAIDSEERANFEGNRCGFPFGLYRCPITGFMPYS
jgi:hypothetical protein